VADERTRACLREATLRANPEYALVLHDRLSSAQQASVRASSWGDGDLYGVLQPRTGTRPPINVVDHDTALLLLTLQAPGCVPHYVIEQCHDTTEDPIAELVLEGVLELERDGRFVSGAAALETLGTTRRAEGNGALARLSSQALRYAEALHIDDSPLLMSRLYG
jgi:hypothetical protein